MDKTAEFEMNDPKTQHFILEQSDNAKKTETSPLADLTLDDKKTSEFKNSSNEFFHFVRLMQLFPSVHPATLHTVMTMCKNDFFLAVDRLLYAKRCKELYDSRRRVFHTSAKSSRCTPYSCNDGCSQNVACARPTFIKAEVAPRRSTRKTRAEKNLSCNGPALQLQLQPEEIQEPITLQTLQCNVPLRPLSPIIQEEISSSHHAETVEGVEVVTQI